MFYYAETVVQSLNNLIERGVQTVDTKKIRMINNIEPSDKAKICFIGLNLKSLEKKGYLKLIRKKSPKKYKLPQNKIKEVC